MKYCICLSSIKFESIHTLRMRYFENFGLAINSSDDTNIYIIVEEERRDQKNNYDIFIYIPKLSS